MAPAARAPALLVSGAAANSTPAPAVAVLAAAAACCEDEPTLQRVWRAIQGCNDWEGLVEPLHLLLRAELVRYGELVAACYKAFDVDPASKRYLKCKYGKGSLMREVGMGASGYTVTRYLYLTPGFGGALSRRRSHGRWIGYVAVASDREARRLGRRDVVVTFRGTATVAEWAANLMSSLTPARLDPGDPRPDVKVEWGFLSMYTSSDVAGGGFGHGGCREQLLAELSRILGEYEGEELSVTFAGHSMGGAMAILAGYDLAELGLNRNRRRREVPVTVYSFGGPRVGNAGFKARCEELGVKVLRVVNVKDPITKVPGVFLNENLVRVLGELLPYWSCCSSCYAHVGVEVALDFFMVKDLAGVHDLGTYLRLLRSPGVAAQVGKLEEEDEGGDLLGKIRRSRSKRRFHALPWLNAAASVGKLVQSLGLV